MINELQIRNYQSLEDVSLTLEPFTVIVGQSSAGKSALTRAFKALAQNQLGKDFITHGQSTATIKAVTDRGTIVLTKGKPEDSYVILPVDDIENPKRYTKLGGTVPSDVTTFLGIEPKDAINFAGQFDMPYLLKSSGAEVAKVLGELTNVASIFEASREALRLKNSFVSLLRTRTADQESLTPKIESYRNLSAQNRAIDAAEQALSAAENLAARKTRLNDILLTLSTATGRKKAAAGRTELPVPVLDPALGVLNRKQEVDAVIRALEVASRNQAQANNNIEISLATEEELMEEYNRLLVELGTCPLCNQSTKELEHTHAA